MTSRPPFPTPVPSAARRRRGVRALLVLLMTVLTYGPAAAVLTPAASARAVATVAASVPSSGASPGSSTAPLADTGVAITLAVLLAVALLLGGGAVLLLLLATDGRRKR